MPPLSFSATQLTLARLRVWVAEWAFWDSWSVRVEYNFIGLNNQTFSSADDRDCPTRLCVGPCASLWQYGAFGLVAAVLGLGNAPAPFGAE
jgi:hypothetical protein